MICNENIIINKNILNISKYFIVILTLMIFFNACSKDDNPGSVNSTPGTNEIFISGMAFNPADKTISVVTTLKWINKDNVTHTVTSGVPGTPSGVFDSGNLATNGEFSFTFNSAGTFKYFCKIHTSMTGTITVQ